ncbi:MAG: prepilin-type N-terminal cleavage/methylation domain-containing protein [Pirellulales bacterium]|nr:prepilin-type N-terminal cleavage/methylation domain-containing protein [Pirellulales bacterium]
MQRLKTDRRAFTLVELLVVIVILSLITVATIPIVRPALDTRRVREAARLLSAQITEAQARAAEIGRPAGIWIEKLRMPASTTGADFEPAAAMNLYLCEVPQPYAGDNTNSVAGVTIVPTGSQSNIVTAPGFPPVSVTTYQGLMTLSAMDTSWIGILRPGDLVQFAYRGIKYRLLNPNSSSNSNVTLDPKGNYKPTAALAIFPIEPAFDTEFIYNYATTPRTKVTPIFRYLPPAALAGGWNVPFQIFRQPIRLSTTPLQMPGNTAVDLLSSGVGLLPFYQLDSSIAAVNQFVINDLSTNDGILNRQPIIITFKPTGSLDKLYMRGNQFILSDPLYLLVGKREKIAAAGSSPSYSAADDRETQTDKHNFRDLENIWVAVNPQSGLVTTAEVAEFPDASITGANDTEKLINALNRSRQLATSAQTMGGR